jgi:hypothetical protein
MKVEIDEKEINGKRFWRWREDYKGHAYGEFTYYAGEPMAELEEYANHRWLEIKNKIDSHAH